MADELRVYGLVGMHAENLHSGRMLGPGEMVTEEELAPEDKWLMDEGRLMLSHTYTRTEDMDKSELRERARDLDIEGRSTMSTDKLQKAVDKATREKKGR